jgi:hypothetical protein
MTAMAKPPRKSTGKKTRRRRVRLSMPAVIGLVIIMLIFTTIAFPTVSIFLVGMIPTLVSFIVDVTPGRYAFRCVAAMNFAGVAPFLRLLWNDGHNMSVAMGIIADPFSWLVFYGTAAFGWGLFFSVPGVVSAFQTLNAEHSVNTLRLRQNALAEEWGTAITGENWKPHEIKPQPDADAATG